MSPMSDNSVSEALLSLSQAMLAAATANEWNEVGKLEMQRQALLEKVEAEIAAGGSDIVALGDLLRKVLALNKRMIALGERSRAELLEAMGGLSQGRKAVNAYYSV